MDYLVFKGQVIWDVCYQFTINMRLLKKHPMNPKMSTKHFEERGSRALKKPSNISITKLRFNAT